MAIKALKGLRALHEVEPPSQIESVSDAVASALDALKQEDAAVITEDALSKEYDKLPTSLKQAQNVDFDGTRVKEGGLWLRVVTMDEVARARTIIADEIEMKSTSAEQSKPVDREAPPVPSLFVSGSDAIRVAGEATEADRVREYGLLAEIDAKLSANADQMDQIKAVIAATETTLTAARNTESETFKAWEELQAQRVETVDRILKLNQMTIDNEAARLRRGQ